MEMPHWTKLHKIHHVSIMVKYNLMSSDRATEAVHWAEKFQMSDW